MKEQKIKADTLSLLNQIRDNSNSAKEILESTNGKLSNAQLAQVHDLSYKVIRSKRLNKILNERTFKNKVLYEKIEKKIKELSSSFNYKELR